MKFLVTFLIAMSLMLSVPVAARSRNLNFVGEVDCAGDIQATTLFRLHTITDGRRGTRFLRVGCVSPNNLNNSRSVRIAGRLGSVSVNVSIIASKRCIRQNMPNRAGSVFCSDSKGEVFASYRVRR